MMMNFEINQACTHNNDYVQMLFVAKRRGHKWAQMYKHRCCTFVVIQVVIFLCVLQTRVLIHSFLFCRSKDPIQVSRYVGIA